MALVRTRLAFERTIMSWVRTAAALIAFGFTLAKANQFLTEHDVRAPFRLFSLKEFSIVTIATGVFAVVLATIQQLRHTKALHRLDRELPVFSVGQILAILFIVLGVCVLLEAILLQY